MAVLTFAICTTHASKYLLQLCKHWNHRFFVEFTRESGRVPFNDTAEVVFEADGSALYIKLSVADQAELARYEIVVADHLKRFAFREELDIAWNA
jgi:hypothetical protein